MNQDELTYLKERRLRIWLKLWHNTGIVKNKMKINTES